MAPLAITVDTIMPFIANAGRICSLEDRTTLVHRDVLSRTKRAQQFYDILRFVRQVLLLHNALVLAIVAASPTLTLVKLLAEVLEEIDPPAVGVVFTVCYNLTSRFLLPVDKIPRVAFLRLFLSVHAPHGFKITVTVICMACQSGGVMNTELN